MQTIVRTVYFSTCLHFLQFIRDVIFHVLTFTCSDSFLCQIVLVFAINLNPTFKKLHFKQSFLHLSLYIYFFFLSFLLHSFLPPAIQGFLQSIFPWKMLQLPSGPAAVNEIYTLCTLGNMQMHTWNITEWFIDKVPPFAQSVVEQCSLSVTLLLI